MSSSKTLEGADAGGTGDIMSGPGFGQERKAEGAGVRQDLISVSASGSWYLTLGTYSWTHKLMEVPSD